VGEGVRLSEEGPEEDEGRCGKDLRKRKRGLEGRRSLLLPEPLPTFLTYFIYS